MAGRRNDRRKGRRKDIDVTVTAQSFKDALSRFATGVCVVTAVGEGGKPDGLTISSFTSVSLDPPLVLFCLGRKSAGLVERAQGARFAVNILGEDQEEISEIFASQLEDKLTRVAWSAGEGGCPLIKDALASVECSLHASYDGGDHLIVLGLIERLSVLGGKPLLRYRGRYLRLP